MHNDDGEHLLLNPGETVLGMTTERLSLADNLCGWLEGRSRFARHGLMVHISGSIEIPSWAGDRRVQRVQRVQLTDHGTPQA